MEQIDTKKKYKLKRFINQLKNVRGRHTELVTVYIPKDYSIIKVTQQLAQEKDTASNIKDKRTRTNVQDSLERLIRHLRLYKETPPNGLAAFAGNISENESKVDIEVFSLEPPFPITTRLYRCDQTFVLDELEKQLESNSVHGLVVMDKREATVGLLKGSYIEKLHNLTSGVPGKYKTGGQCLSPDTLIMKYDGEIIEIKEGHNPLLIASENFNLETTEETPIIAKWENKKKLFKITTCYPKIEIKSSRDHLFFVRTKQGIEEKQLSEIGKGDYLIIPEKINLKLEYQKLDFYPKIFSTRNLKKLSLSEYLTEDLARILGYYLGDGCYEIDRLSFFEQRKDVAGFYKKLIEKTFNLEVKYRFRKDKNYHQLRVYSRIVSQLFKQIFKEDKKTLNEKIPSIILKSPDSVLASFLAGFFDAEGYISNNRIGLGINNQYITRQLQFCLLRLGIIGSLWEYDNRKNFYSNNIRYSISIEDIKSLENFYRLIGFMSKEKQKKINFAIKNKGRTSKIRQLTVNGKEIARILRNSGYATDKFHASQFFVNKRQMSKEIFKEKILNKIDDEQLKKRLEMFYNSNLIIVKIANIKELEETTTVDIETKNHNFIANGIIVHNSAARFSRLREQAAKEFYQRIAEVVNQEFLNKKELKGIIIGGPGPTKNEFFDGPFINNEVKKKVIGLKDITYTDEFGLEELVEKSKDLLADEGVTAEKQVLHKFLSMLATDPKRTAYGLKDVEKALEYGAVEMLIILEGKIDDKKAEELEEKAANSGAKTEIVSEDTQEGKQFKNLGGIGAILRFPIH